MSKDELQASQTSSASKKVKMESDTSKGTEDKNDKSRNSHSEIEKRRRDKMNQYINDLSTMVPIPPSLTRKPDKLTVLRLTVQHMKALHGSAEPLKETSHKPSFVSDGDLRNLITEASGGFLLVVDCDRGQILYVTDSVEGVLNITQADVLRSNFYELVHSKDVSKAKTQLSTTTTNSKKGEKTDTNVVPVVKGNTENCGTLCPGAKRSFLCRMKKGVKTENSENVFGSQTERNSSVRKTKSTVLLDEKDHVMVSLEGYLKAWPPNEEAKSSSDSSSCCLVAIARAVAVHDEQTDYAHPGQTWEFETRHRADGVFVRVDNSFTTIFGYYPDEIIGKSAYNFFHKDDLKDIADIHQQTLLSSGRRPEVMYRFRAKAGHYVPLHTVSFAFRNPWSKEVDYIITKNNVLTPTFSSLRLINDRRMLQNQTANQGKREGSVNVGYSHDLRENIRDLLKRLENFDGSEGKIPRKRAVGYADTSKPGENKEKTTVEDIGVLIAEQARKIDQDLTINTQAGQYSNTPLPEQSNVQNGVSSEFNSATASSRAAQPQMSELNRRHGGFNDIIGVNPRSQSSFADGILMEQLAGIQGAIDTMENTSIGSGDDDERLSLLMNVIDSDEDLGSVLNDMPWNFM